MEIVPKAGMAVLLLASVPLGGDPSAWAQWGLAGLVVSYTLWRDYHREKRMGHALDTYQKWVQGSLMAALERNTLALERMGSRPCMGDERPCR